MSRWIRSIASILACAVGCVLGASCGHAPRPETPVSMEFGNPERVSILGYSGDAMEPFVSRDGKILFFNNLNEPQVNTNLYWAERVDDLHFRYRGEIQGVNTAALEGVASMDRDGNFYFVSNRSYDQTASTLYRGKFANGSITGIELVPGVSLAKGGIVNFDAEISADGNTLYFVESQFSIFHQPQSAIILIARRSGNTFVRDAASEALLKTVNDPDALDYAPATTADELEIYFTRVNKDHPEVHGPQIFVAKRASRALLFGSPLRIGAITGFVEGPTLSPDGKSLYYHRKEDGHFVIYRVTRP